MRTREKPECSRQTSVQGVIRTAHLLFISQCSSLFLSKDMVVASLRINTAWDRGYIALYFFFMSLAATYFFRPPAMNMHCLSSAGPLCQLKGSCTYSLNVWIQKIILGTREREAAGWDGGVFSLGSLSAIKFLPIKHFCHWIWDGNRDRSQVSVCVGGVSQLAQGKPDKLYYPCKFTHKSFPVLPRYIHPRHHQASESMAWHGMNRTAKQ